LTTLAPTPGDWRYRAAFWTAWLDTAPAEPARRAAVLANCQAMRELADKLENPAPVARLVPRAKPSKAKPAQLGAADFWSLHSAAVRAIVAEHGAAWQCNRPDQTVLVSLPARLCSYVGPLGGRIRWRRDHRMPAPAYWPGGRLPDGVEAAPVAPRYDGPMGDDHPSLVRIRAAVAEQIMRDRIGRGRAAIISHWRQQHMTSLLQGKTYAPTGKTYRGYQQTRAQRLDNMALAANCRRAMLAELAELAAAA
jgi:hypothetical protein